MWLAVLINLALIAKSAVMATAGQPKRKGQWDAIVVMAGLCTWSDAKEPVGRGAAIPIGTKGMRIDLPEGAEEWGEDGVPRAEWGRARSGRGSGSGRGGG